MEKGTADECEQSVDGRLDAVNAALELCGSRQNAAKLAILPQSLKDGGKPTFLSTGEGDQIKASHRYLGIIYPAMLSMSAEIDQRIWATNRAWRELYGMWWNTKVPCKIKRTLFRGAVFGASLTGLTALLHHDRDLRLQRCFERSSALLCSARLLGKDKSYRDS